MATTKALRARAPRKTENYVASIKRLFGDPQTVPDKQFLAGKYITSGTNLITPGANEEAYSIVEPIGFGIEINGKTYTEFSVAMAGWIFLRDPAGGSTSASFWTDILNGFTNIYDNHSISASFSYNHIFLPIWFDRNHSPGSTVAAIKAFDASSTITDNIQANIEAGIDTDQWPYDSLDYGVRYVNYYDSIKGKCLLVRWTASQRFYNHRLKFEIALFENGVIEYRYWPLKKFKSPYPAAAAASSATVGVFWHESGKSYQWRDFAPLLGYQLGERSMSPLGGANYSAAYTDSSAVYANRISATEWPKNGAIITYTPPVNPGKFLPRKIASLIGTTKHLAPNSGLFDDRKTINFYSGSTTRTVNMPSTMPSRLLGDTSGDVNISLRQLLFTSGSLEIPGAMKKSTIDSNLEMLNVIDVLQKPFNNSFNESQKNYQETASTSSFYMTGSALEIFGNGFTAPLKSKTQFHFSLPVTKQIMMPSLTSSFYYYDSNRKTWTMVDPNGYRNPERIFSEFDNITYADSYNTDFATIYRVVETSRGFDSVGRKLVSGSNVINFAYDNAVSDESMSTFQSSDELGKIFNDYDNVLPYRRRNVTPISQDYNNSITDNPAFFPTTDQTFSFPVEEAFLVEKIVVDIPLYISGAWFNDLTTCVRPHAHFTGAIANDPQAIGRFLGPIDFGGPGITFALMCGRRGENNTYLDLIASGTITHMNDAITDVILKKDPSTHYHSMRPTGFLSFSNPTYIISGSNNIFEGTVKLEMEASVAGGLTFARNDRSLLSASNSFTDAYDYQVSNRNKAIELLTTKSILTDGGVAFNIYDRWRTTLGDYQTRTPRVYLQQVSPLSRGSAGFNFNGNSILGGNIASFNLEPVVKNPLYSGYATSAELSAKYTDQINSASFGFDAVSIYSTVDSRPAPYLLLPGDKLTISMSKTRPVIHKAVDTGDGFMNFGARYETYILTGSHGTVMLNTGSINITVYGSYIQEGTEYHP